MMAKSAKQRPPQPKGGKTLGAGVLTPVKTSALPAKGAIPPLPEKAQKVLALLSDTDVSVEKLRRLIAADAALSSKILNIANFDFYGAVKTMPNLNHAIMRLGFNAVRNIVVATSIKDVFKRFGRDEELLWTAMMGSAIASSIIARHTKLVDPEDAFIGGLLHDVGKVYLLNEAPALYMRAIKTAETRHIPFDAAVNLETGKGGITTGGGMTPFNHRQTGAMIVKKWGFPETLASMLKKFDNTDELAGERYIYNLVTVITFADLICLALGIGSSGEGVIPPSGGALPRRSVEGVISALPEMRNLSDSLGVDEKGFKKLAENIHAAFSQGIKLY